MICFRCIPVTYIFLLFLILPCLVFVYSPSSPHLAELFALVVGAVPLGSALSIIGSFHVHVPQVRARTDERSDHFTKHTYQTPPARCAAYACEPGCSVAAAVALCTFAFSFNWVSHGLGSWTGLAGLSFVRANYLLAGEIQGHEPFCCTATAGLPAS